MVWVRVLTRSSRCSTIARRAVTVPSTAAEFNLGALRAAIPTLTASASSFLRPWPVDSMRTRAASFAGTSTTSTPSVRSRAVRGAPRPDAPSIAHVGSGHRSAKRRNAR